MLDIRQQKAVIPERQEAKNALTLFAALRWFQTVVQGKKPDRIEEMELRVRETTVTGVHHSREERVPERLQAPSKYSQCGIHRNLHIVIIVFDTNHRSCLVHQFVFHF